MLRCLAQSPIPNLGEIVHYYKKVVAESRRHRAEAYISRSIELGRQRRTEREELGREMREADKKSREEESEYGFWFREEQD
jgi:hypothetical protein